MFYILSYNLGKFTTILTLIQGKSEYTIASIEQSETPENCDKIYGHILWATSPNSDKSKILFVEYNPSNMLLKVKITLVPGYLTKLKSFIVKILFLLLFVLESAHTEIRYLSKCFNG